MFSYDCRTGLFINGHKMADNHHQLIDRYDRHISYLRISLTDRCNLHCLYCMTQNGICKLRHEDILTYEEILRLARVAIKLGINKIRLTGGEPLIRKGIYEFMPQLTALEGLKDVSLTTNGIYINKNIEKIRSAGIKRINVSLDTLQKEKYEKITGYNGFQEVWKGIESALKLKFNPIKINVVLIRGLNDDEILDLAMLTMKYPYHVRFIEYMPFGVINPDVSMHYVPNFMVKARIEGLGKLVKVSGTAFDGPAERFRFEGAPGEIGFISPRSNHFCFKCNRIRITASGDIMPCLLSDRKENLKGPMRLGAKDSELEQIFFKALIAKPSLHHLSIRDEMTSKANMSSIGG